MATYIVLSNFTEQGMRNVKDTTKRADAVKELAKKCGATAKEFYWTLGKYDVVAIFEAPDEASITALGLGHRRGRQRPDTDDARLHERRDAAEFWASCRSGRARVSRHRVHANQAARMRAPPSNAATT